MLSACALRREQCGQRGRATLHRSTVASATLVASGHAGLIVVVRAEKSRRPVSHARVWIATRSDSVPGTSQTEGSWRYESQSRDSVRYRVRGIGYAGASGIVAWRHGFVDTLDVRLPVSYCGGAIVDRVPG